MASQSSTQETEEPKQNQEGQLLSTLGYGVMTVAAHLGGKMVYEYRVGVDRTSGDMFPVEFTAVMPEGRN